MAIANPKLRAQAEMLAEKTTRERVWDSKKESAFCAATLKAAAQNIDAARFVSITGKFTKNGQPVTHDELIARCHYLLNGAFKRAVKNGKSEEDAQNIAAQYVWTFGEKASTTRGKTAEEKLSDVERELKALDNVDLFANV